MQLLRTIWFYTSFYFVTLGTIPVLLLRNRLDPGGEGVRRASVWWLSMVLRLAGIRLHADLSAIPDELKGTPLVFVANHQSNFDIPLVMQAAEAWHPVFMAKQSLLDIPFFGACLRAGGHIGVDRDNPRKAVRSMDAAVSVAGKGRSVIVFPEGTRNKDPRTLGKFRAGGALIALRAGLPVVPLVLEGTADLLPSGKLILGTRRDVYLRALPPFDLSAYGERDKNAFSNALRDTMESTYQEMRSCPKM
ncbi:lysophospholipid acyltransferase family protein [Oleidesulfovibrio sp.]|uniref:lysophospholipid acyltransferase family protein n=1 Tax=Oleidesulfovibrio sp. TaxID=2909707 RepID=UPI003A8ADC6D